MKRPDWVPAMYAPVWKNILKNHHMSDLMVVWAAM